MAGWSRRISGGRIVWPLRWIANPMGDNPTGVQIPLPAPSYPRTFQLTSSIFGHNTQNKAAIEQKNARLLYSIDAEHVRNYCEVCDKLYCGEHWKITPIMNDDWCDGFVWTCSRGHHKEF
jgi:hypothetical protein